MGSCDVLTTSAIINPIVRPRQYDYELIMKNSGIHQDSVKSLDDQEPLHERCREDRPRSPFPCLRRPSAAVHSVVPSIASLVPPATPLSSVASVSNASLAPYFLGDPRSSPYVSAGANSSASGYSHSAGP